MFIAQALLLPGVESLGPGRLALLEQPGTPCVLALFLGSLGNGEGTRTGAEAALSRGIDVVGCHRLRL
jgi:hypothetical protein